MPRVTIPAQSSTPAGEQSFQGIIGPNVGNTFSVSTGNTPTIGFMLTSPAGGRVVFEGSWNGTDWTDVTLRSMGSHGYSSTTAENESWIGSVITFKFFRLRTIQAGTAPGTINGQFSPVLCTLEGSENGPMPHRIGSVVKAATFSYAESQSDDEIIAPTDETHKIIISDIHFTITDATSLVTFSDGPVADGFVIFQGNFKPTAGTSIYVPISFSLPHVFSATGRSFLFSQSNAASIVGVVHYYESE